ncbi:predicted protein [Histoplasma capsulatum G186AR]|uniref:Uncharacterized protein n=1 Tax=Ajellomyces capsulatus (strain G186AR / H82 / ATCC MYA-2454 / RMSCC 2432) TaxID=447093 RepID=C0NVB3_AJECG|nr:uncharacterized protein HCBG_07093 [Histoplasma capsulatum G186AR]EEH04452.1 predicted protein [Histoplasma capsulatum G186AR]
MRLCGCHEHSPKLNAINNETSSEDENLMMGRTVTGQSSSSQGKIIPQKREFEPDCLPVSMPSSHDLTSTTESRSILDQLPHRDPITVFSISLDVEDVFLLGLSCRGLWTLVTPVIAKHFAGYLGVWAGIPVISVLWGVFDQLERGRLMCGDA